MQPLMAPKIKPFKALIYNQEKIQDLSKVVCPPYDVISAQEQEQYYSLQPHNFIRIILGKDIDGEDKYSRAQDCFKQWQKEQILIQDKSPAIYFYNHQYYLRGEKKNRFGFIALLKLDDKGEGIFGHEHTRQLAKEDRARLLDKVKANLSPIFVVFPDQKRIISLIQEKYIKNISPFIDIVDEDKSRHRLYRIDSPPALSKIEEAIQRESLFIADGHHRYEVALAYREGMLQGKEGGDGKYDYIMAYFTNTDAHGLTILPIHRLVKLKDGLDILKFKSGVIDLFDMEEVKDKNKFFFLLNKAGSREHIIGMYSENKYFLLRLKSIKALDKIINDKPQELRQIDVCILNYLILKNTLGLDLEDKEAITFSPEQEELIKRVDEDSHNVAFFVNAVKIQQVMAVALRGEKMPSKSTYFYPKVLSGLVVNKLE